MADAEPEPESPNDDATGPTRQQLEKFRRDLAEFVRLETLLAATSRAPRLRRAGADALGVLAVVVALVAVFALVNVAILLAIATVLPAWAAALILAGAWLCVAGIKGAYLARRGAPVLAALRGDGSGAPTALITARDAAWQDLREDLESLGPPLADQAVAVAVPLAVRLATRMAAAAAGGAVEGVVVEVEDVGRDLVEESEEVVEELAEDVPGASIANTVWSLALLPGRTGVRMVATVLKRPPPGD